MSQTEDPRPATPILDRVTLPSDLKGLTDRELVQLADELRAETISAVSETGGHLGAGLGVVELTVALHAVFDAPRPRAAHSLTTRTSVSMCSGRVARSTSSLIRRAMQPSVCCS